MLPGSEDGPQDAQHPQEAHDREAGLRAQHLRHAREHKEEVQLVVQVPQVRPLVQHQPHRHDLRPPSTGTVNTLIDTANRTVQRIERARGFGLELMKTPPITVYSVETETVSAESRKANKRIQRPSESANPNRSVKALPAPSP
eukprot:9155701-Pyramimonas_sp.AAC.1